MEGKGDLSKAVESYYMAEPLTPKKTLEENATDMKTRMELLIMRIQVHLLGYI